MQTNLDFISGNTKKCLLTMSLPMMAAMFLNMAYNLVDSLWIGNLLGETAYAALTGATPLILILNSVAMGAANGVSILLSQAVGARDHMKVQKMIATSLVLSILFSAGVTLLLELSLPSLLGLLQTPRETFQMAYEYLSVYLLGYVAVYLYCYFTAILRSFGNSSFQVVAMLVCTLLNAVLDPVFIWLYALKGAAFATLLSQGLCLVFMVCYLMRKQWFAFRLSAFEASAIPAFLAKGIPSAFQQSIPALSTGFLTSLIGGYGVQALAAYGIAGKLECILFYPAMALNMVLTVIVGQCIGAKRADRARDYIKLSLLYGGGLLVLLSVPIVLFSRGLAGLFVDSPGAAAIAARYFKIVGAGYLLNTVTNCFLGTLNGLGKPGQSMLCMVFYYLVVRMPLSWMLSALGLGLEGIWCAVLCSHLAAAMAAAFMALRQLGSGRGRGHLFTEKSKTFDCPREGGMLQ